MRSRRSALLASTSRTRRFSSKFPPVVSLSVCSSRFVCLRPCLEIMVFSVRSFPLFHTSIQLLAWLGHRCQQKTRGRLQNHNPASHRRKRKYPHFREHFHMRSRTEGLPLVYPLWVNRKRNSTTQCPEFGHPVPLCVRRNEAVKGGAILNSGSISFLSEAKLVTADNVASSAVRTQAWRHGPGRINLESTSRTPVCVGRLQRSQIRPSCITLR